MLLGSGKRFEELPRTFVARQRQINLQWRALGNKDDKGCE